MGSCRKRIAALAGAAVVAGVSATSAATAANFDGHWTLVAQTTKGHCGVTQWGVAISGGRLYYPGGFFMGYPVGLSGTVAPSGRTRVIVTAGPRVGRGAGQLGKVQGRGTWAGKGPSGTCSGIWTATRASVGAPAPYWMPFWTPYRR